MAGRHSSTATRREGAARHPPCRPAVFAVLAACAGGFFHPALADDPGPGADTVRPRYVAPPRLAAGLSAGAFEWTAAVDCSAGAALTALLGARVTFSLDFDLDGAADATDSLDVSPADCGAVAPGHVALRRRLAPAHPAVLRATLRAADGTAVAAHAALAAGIGDLLAFGRYCAAPRNGEPEWIEVRNRTAFAIPAGAALLEGRVLEDSLAPGAALVAGADTAELRLWQPGARLVALSSWSNLRNSGDTIRLSVPFGDASLVIDSVIYGAGGAGEEACASREEEGTAAAAHGYALELSPRGALPRSVAVRAPEGGRYDLRAYDPDGVLLCVPARGAVGPADYPWPGPECRSDRARRAGTVILHLAPRGAPGVRAVLRAGSGRSR